MLRVGFESPGLGLLSSSGGATLPIRKKSPAVRLKLRMQVPGLRV